jgi:D-alanyl-D-alanine carboxypeptidase (penicillin-binding protein 5/6)
VNVCIRCIEKTIVSSRLFLAAMLALGIALPSLTLAAIPVPSAPKLAARAYLLVDVHSGKVLAENNADERMEPASLTKLMTAYIAFDELNRGTIHLDDEVLISEKAWRTGGSKMFIEVNKHVSVEKLLKGMIIQSGNDASVALAEHIAGTEDAFATLMNSYAEQLGMTNTHFVNATGMPNREHYTTASDLAKLAVAIIKESPDHYAWYSIKKYTYNGITQYNRNKLLWRDKYVDGLKTGHTESAGYCLIASAKRENMRLISVVLGTRSEDARAQESEKLLNYGFHFFETRPLYTANTPLTKTRVWEGNVENLNLGLAKDLYITIPRGRFDNLETTMNIDDNIIAPVKKGQALGSLDISLEGEQIATRPLIGLHDVIAGDFFQRMSDKVMLMFE